MCLRNVRKWLHFVQKFELKKSHKIDHQEHRIWKILMTMIYDDNDNSKNLKANMVSQRKVLA